MATATTVRAVVDAVGALPVFAKLSPNATDVVPWRAPRSTPARPASRCVNTMRAFLVDADAATAPLGAGNGGLSGPAIKPIALRIVHDVSRALPGVPIIGTGGVSTGEDAVEMLLAGATAVGVGTATFLDPGATLRIADELVELVRSATASPGSPTSPAPWRSETNEPSLDTELTDERP